VRTSLWTRRTLPSGYATELQCKLGCGWLVIEPNGVDNAPLCLTESRHQIRKETFDGGLTHNDRSESRLPLPTRCLDLEKGFESGDQLLRGFVPYREAFRSATNLSDVVLSHFFWDVAQRLFTHDGHIKVGALIMSKSRAASWKLAH